MRAPSYLPRVGTGDQRMEHGTPKQRKTAQMQRCSPLQAEASASHSGEWGCTAWLPPMLFLLPSSQLLTWLWTQLMFRTLTWGTLCLCSTPLLHLFSVCLGFSQSTWFFLPIAFWGFPIISQAQGQAPLSYFLVQLWIKDNSILAWSKTYAWSKSLELFLRPPSGSHIQVEWRQEISENHCSSGYVALMYCWYHWWLSGGGPKWHIGWLRPLESTAITDHIYT